MSQLDIPTVTREHISALLDQVSVHYYHVPNTTTTVATAIAGNGFTLACEFAACVSPELFDEKIGREIAHDEVMATAENKLWELEGYALKLSL